MRQLAIKFYKQNYNCSQCILKAASVKFNFDLSQQALDICSTINNGFGIQSTCSAIIGCLMSLGIIFNNIDAKRIRIKFLNEFICKYKSINCAQLKRQDLNKYKCEKLISDMAEIFENIILNEI